MKIKLILLFVLFYLLSLFITLPADKLLPFIPENSDIKVAAVSGTLWNGKAVQISYKEQFQVQKIDWKVDWSALSSLQFKLAVKFSNGAQALSGKGFILLGLSGWSAENFIIDSSAAELLAYAPLPVPAEVSGALSLVIKKASPGQPYCQQLDGKLIWQNGKISSDFGNIDLNGADIDLSCKDGQLLAELQQNSEQLTAKGDFLLKSDGVYQLQGTLQAGKKLDPAIKDALSWIGRKNSAGETVVSFNGKL